MVNMPGLEPVFLLKITVVHGEDIQKIKQENLTWFNDLMNKVFKEKQGKNL